MGWGDKEIGVTFCEHLDSSKGRVHLCNRYITVRLSNSFQPVLSETTVEQGQL